MLCISWMLLLDLSQVWGPVTLMLAASSAPQSVSQYESQDRETEFKSVPPARPTWPPVPAPTFLHAYRPPHAPLTQRTQHKSGHLRLLRSLSLLPQSSRSWMHRHSRVKPSRSNRTFIAKTTCPPVLVLLDSVDSDHEQGKQPNVSCQTNPTCVIKDVKIHTTDNQRPLKVFRNRDLTLLGHVSYDCPDSNAKVYGGWFYDQVSKVGDVPDWTTSKTQSQVLLTSNANILKVDKSYLNIGVYIFNYTVSIIRSEDLPVLVASDTLYVIAEKPPLRAIIGGPTLLTVKFTEDFILDGSLSIDLDVQEPKKGLIFSWYCTTDIQNLNNKDLIMFSKKVCSPDQTSLRWFDHRNSTLKILAKTLKGGRLYNFRLEIQKDVRKAHADKIVYVQQGPRPAAVILCVENCATILTLSDTLSLFVNITNGTPNRDECEWFIQSSDGHPIEIDWYAQTTKGTNRQYFSVIPFGFRNFTEGKYFVSVRVTAWSGQIFLLRHSITINTAPIPGECKINPDTGIALATKFVFQCSDFQDKDTPLTYKLIVSDAHNLANISSLKENTMGGIPYFGNESTSSFFLPVGDLSNQYSLKLYVQVYDTHGSYSQVTLNTTVLNPSDDLSPLIVLQQLHNLTLGPSSTFTDLIQKNDSLHAGYLIFVAASVLNQLKSDPLVQQDRVKLREHLVNQTLDLPLSTSEEITQVVAALAKLTQRISDFNEVSQERCTKSISQANQSLQDKGFPSKQIDTVCTGTLTILSNLLKLLTPHKNFGDLIYVTESLADTLLSSVLPHKESTVMQSPCINMYVKKTTKWKATKIVVQEEIWNDFQAVVHIGNVFYLSENALISSAFTKFAKDPFPWLTYPENISTEVVALQMSKLADDGEVKLTPLVVEVFLTRKFLNSGVYNITVGPTNRARRTTAGAFMFEVDCFQQKEVLVHIITEVSVLFTVSVYAGGNLTDDALIASYLVPHDIPPMSNQSNLLDSTCSVKVARVLCLSPSLLQVIAGRVQSTECLIAVFLRAPRFVDHPNDKLVRISVFRHQCLDKSDIQSDWNEHTCTPGERSSWERVHCVCKNEDSEQQQTTPAQAKQKQYSLYVGAKVTVIHNPLDLYYSAVRSVSYNPVIPFVIIFIMITYIGLAFWALHRDETDQFLRHHVIILPDNDPYDKTFYLVTVFTGSRCGSGTTANVFVQLQGTESASDVHCLSHPQFTSLYTGGIDTFLITTKSVLGDIHSIRVWHDNEGSSPTWYLSRIKVENLFTRQIWLFMCREWISEESSLDRTYSPSLPDQPISTTDFFLIETTYKTWKSHMWLSVFADVVDTPFNRIQRLSCCLATLLSSLLCITLILRLTPSEEKESPQQMYTRSMMIGVQSVLITLPVQMIITALFIYSQRKPQVTLKEVTPHKHPDIRRTQENWRSLLAKWYREETSEKLSEKKSTADHEHIVKGTKPSSTNKNLNNIKGKDDGQIHSKKKPSKAKSIDTQTKTQFSLPPYFAYLAWFLICAICAISIFFVVSHGLAYDDESAVKWLVASFCALLLSIFLVQPIKVFVFTAMRTCRSKYCKDIFWVSSYQYTEIKLENVNMPPSTMAQIHDHIVSLHMSPLYQPPPISYNNVPVEVEDEER